MSKMRALNRRSHGFSMVEVLIAVFVLAVGVVGVARLQVTAKRSNLEATQRATAVALAQDLIERMRANASELDSYTNSGVGYVLDGSTLAAVDCSADCTPEQLAQYDLYEFEQALAGVTEQSGGSNSGGLVLPTACITGPNGGSGTYVVSIAWRGLVKLSNPTTGACGAGSGRYDAVTGGVTEADVHRRLLVVETFITPPI